MQTILKIPILGGLLAAALPRNDVPWVTGQPRHRRARPTGRNWPIWRLLPPGRRPGCGPGQAARRLRKIYLDGHMQGTVYFRHGNHRERPRSHGVNRLRTTTSRCSWCSPTRRHTTSTTTTLVTRGSWRRTRRTGRRFARVRTRVRCSPAPAARATPPVNKVTGWSPASGGSGARSGPAEAGTPTHPLPGSDADHLAASACRGVRARTGNGGMTGGFGGGFLGQVP